jgi:hypothetical protein
MEVRNLFLASFLLISCIALSQTRSRTIDHKSKQFIPFVNIWVEGKDIGTTSDEEGLFSLPAFSDDVTLCLSAIGYAPRKIQISNVGNVVELQPKAHQLPTLEIRPPKSSKEIIVGGILKKNISTYFACGNKPWIIAKRYAFKENYTETPFIKSLKLCTKSDVKNATFNLRFYAVKKDGKPGKLLCGQNVIGVAKKGKHITEVDLSRIGLRFPEDGIFVAVEWLIIPSNKFEYQYTTTDSKKKRKGLSYEPSIGTNPDASNENGWLYSSGQWQKTMHKNSDYQRTYNLLAIELIMSN